MKLLYKYIDSLVAKLIFNLFVLSGVVFIYKVLLQHQEAHFFDNPFLFPVFFLLSLFFILYVYIIIIKLVFRTAHTKLKNFCVKYYYFLHFISLVTILGLFYYAVWIYVSI